MRNVSAIVILGILALSACGGGDGDSGSSATRLSSGLPADKPMNSLNASEAKQFCDNSNQWAAKAQLQSRTTELACRVQGMVAVAGTSSLGSLGGVSSTAAVPSGDVSPPTLCKTAYDDCQKKQAQTGSNVFSLTNNCTVAADCTGTVADVETCMNSLVGRIDGVTKSIPSCDTVTSQTASDSLMAVATFYSEMVTGECAAVSTKCASMNPLVR